jgi:hypothetical protein
MAGMKHAGSGGSRGEVSPLAVQLQQAWLHTQTPKAKKRPVSSSQLTNSCIPRLQQQEQQQSALESLSSIFPELAARLPQKKKPVLFSYFQEDEEPKAREVEVGFNDGALRSSSPSLFPPHDTLQSVANRIHSVTPPSSLAHRLPLSPVVHNSDSSEDLARAAPAVLASHIFSENSTSLASLQDAYSSPDDKGSTPRQGDATSPSDLADLDGVEFFMTEEEANTLEEYVNSFVDEEQESKKCMFVESSAYQAMAQELGDVIAGDDASRFDSETLDKVLYSDDWLNHILSNPVVADVLDGLKKDGSRTSFANDEAGDPLLDLNPGNSGLKGPSWTEMHPPEAATALGAQSSMSQCSFNSESLPACSEDALHHSHIPDGGGNGHHVSKPTSSPWTTNGHPVLPDDLHHLLLR